MARFTLENILASDSQSDLINKLNENFIELSNSDGGIFSEAGPTGERGLIGQVGARGATGKDGKRGSRWFIQDSEPTGTDVNYGDYWLDSSGNCYAFSSSGWSFVDLFKRDQDLFKTVTGVIGPSGESFGKALVLNQEDPSQFGFVFSDNFDGTNGNQNPDGAKMVVSTSPESSSGYLMEFSRIDKEISGHTGEASDFVKHPFFSWYGNPDDSNLKLSIPGGSFTLDYGNQISDNLVISSSGNISFTSGSTSSFNSSSFYSYSDQNWSGANISFSTPNSYFLISNNDNFFFQSGYTLGTSTDYNVNFYPSVSREDGYLKISRNPSSVESDYRTSPLRAVRRFSYGSELNSSQVGLLNLQTSNRVAFSASANGKVYTRKTSERYDNRVFSPIFTYQTSGTNLSNRCNWYEIPPLDEIDGRTIFIDPTLSSIGPPGPLTAGLTGSAYVGVGFNTDSLDNSQILKTGEMVTYRVVCAKQDFSSSVSVGSLSGISMVGYWTTSRPASTTTYKILGTSQTNLSVCTQLDFIVFKSATSMYTILVRGYSFLNGELYTTTFAIT